MKDITDKLKEIKVGDHVVIENGAVLEVEELQKIEELKQYPGSNSIYIKTSDGYYHRGDGSTPGLIDNGLDIVDVKDKEALAAENDLRSKLKVVEVGDMVILKNGQKKKVIEIEQEEEILWIRTSDLFYHRVDGSTPEITQDGIDIVDVIPNYSINLTLDAKQRKALDAIFEALSDCPLISALDVTVTNAEEEVS
jgi:preprotein translocase subunit YajC